jgi:hypothetical protein
MRATPEAWTYHFSAADISELRAAVAGVADVGELVRGGSERAERDFPLPTLGPTLRGIRKDLVNGIGFRLLRGFPVDEFSEAETQAAYLGLGLHIGMPVSQNAMGHVLGHVKDHGEDPHAPTTRVYRTRRRQRFHTDSCDVVGLLCIRPAQAGGTSSLCSSVSVYETLRRARPDLLAELERDLVWDRKGEVPAGKEEWYLGPVVNHHDGKVSDFGL